MAQITKSAHVFVFERETGKPLFPIEYRKVSTHGVEGEVVAETQPFPLKPPAFSRQIFTEDMATLLKSSKPRLNPRTGEMTAGETVNAGGKVKLPNATVIWLTKEN